MEKQQITERNSPRFGGIDYIKVTIYGLGLSALWGGLHSIILPIRLLDFVSVSDKNTYLGFLTFSGLVLAMAVQPVAGAISDRPTFRWGLRRPYILVGSLFILALLPGISLADSYTVIFIVYCLLQLSSNVAQGAYQALIPDLVPQGKRGLASGVKSGLEAIGGIGLVRVVGHFMDYYFASRQGHWLWLSLGSLALLLAGVMLVTIFSVKEKTPVRNARLALLPVIWRSFKLGGKSLSGFKSFLISRLLVLMAFTTLQTFALYYLQDVLGVANPAAATANLVIVIGVCMVGIVYPAGRLSDAIGRKPIVIGSVLLGAGAVLLLMFIKSYGLVLIVGGLIGLSSGAFMSTNWALAVDLAPKKEGARYLGLANLATAGGSAFARLIGPLIDFLNHMHNNRGYLVMLLACFIYFISAAIILARTRLEISRNNAG